MQEKLKLSTDGAEYGSKKCKPEYDDAYGRV
jgi:hypothetical protein